MVKLILGYSIVIACGPWRASRYILAAIIIYVVVGRTEGFHIIGES
ncbi:MAG: hypothetical protein HPY66_2708 [Firmicutes bacterium]|nr:hypothetical protein [Bacillota bacterium]